MGGSKSAINIYLVQSADCLAPDKQYHKPYAIPGCSPLGITGIGFPLSAPFNRLVTATDACIHPLQIVDICSLTRSLSHPHSLSHSPTQSFTHSLTSLPLLTPSSSLTRSLAPSPLSSLPHPRSLVLTPSHSPMLSARVVSSRSLRV